MSGKYDLNTFVIELLNRVELRPILFPSIDAEVFPALQKFFKILVIEFRNLDSDINLFMQSCSHGDIRTALRMFREFMVSGYTDIPDMISKNHWNIKLHQVLKPVMTPSRLYFDEEKSHIVNIFKIRGKDGGSHFTGLRILQMLWNRLDQGRDAYADMGQLRELIGETLGMNEDLEHNIDEMLKRGLIESRNRMDEFSANIDACKITAFGEYFLHTLHLQFTYIDLVCLDCGISKEGIANALIIYANQEFEDLVNKKKIWRLQKRLRRTKVFIEYLIESESFEIQEFGLPEGFMLFGTRIRKSFQNEMAFICKSAKIENIGYDNL